MIQGWEIFENQWDRAHPPQLLGFMLRRCLTNSSLLGFPLEEGSGGETSMFAQFWSPHFANGDNLWTFPIAASALSSAGSSGAAPEQMKPSSGQLRTGRGLLSLLQLALVKSQEQTEGGRGRKYWWL